MAARKKPYRAPEPLIREEDMRTPERQAAIFSVVEEMHQRARIKDQQRALDRDMSRLWGGDEKYRMVFAPSTKFDPSRFDQGKQAGGGRAQACAQPAPGMVPPPSNTGGTEDRAGREVKLVDCNGKIKFFEIRGSSGTDATVDTVSLTCDVRTLDLYDSISIDPASRVSAFSPVIEAIFGFPITGEVPSRNFYHHTYAIGNKLGFVAFGGNADSMQIYLDGAGCLLARPGWEMRLYHWSKSVAVAARICRIDICIDQLDGGINPRDVYAMYKAGAFGPRRPKCNHAGDWEDDDEHQKGLTLYIGRRETGKMLRCYEKGRQLGDPGSEWVRHEVEFKNNDRILPLDMLIFPGRYFAAAYSYLNDFDANPTKVDIEKKSFLTSLQAMELTVKHQFGRQIRFMFDTYKDATVVLEKLMREGLPKAFKHYESAADALKSQVKGINSFDSFFGDLSDLSDIPITT